MSDYITLKSAAIVFGVIAVAAALFYIWLGERLQNLSDDIDEMGDQ